MNNAIRSFTRRAAFAGLAVGMICGTGAGVASAAGYPDKPIRLVLGFAPGGPTDVIARFIGQAITTDLGQPVIIDPRPGADSILGTDIVARSAPDGYTLAMISVSSTIHPSVYKDLPYDLLKSFVPIAIMTKGAYVIIVHPSQPVHNLKELFALAKQKDGKMNYAGANIGDSLNLAGELLQAQGGFKMTLIPYHGGGPALTALLGGETELMISPISIAAPQVKQGAARAIAVTSSTRDPSLPDVPTVAESGVPGYEVTGWYGLIAPAGTPPDVAQALNRSVNKGLAAADSGKVLGNLSMVPVGGSLEETRRFLESEVTKWAKVVKDAKIPQSSLKQP